MGYRYKVNHEFFDEIDNEYKAYLLGFIYADGNIKEQSGNRQKRLTICFSEEDSYILNNISQLAGNPIKTFYPRQAQEKGWKKMSVFSLTSNKICERLIELGCNIRKSQVGMKFPTLKKEFIHHFIRGFLDGDGSIILKKVANSYVRKTNHEIKNAAPDYRYLLKIAFASTDRIFLENIVKHLNIEKFYMAEKKRKNVVYILWIENSSEVKKAVETIYKNASIFFKRKLNKVLEYNMTTKSQAKCIHLEGLETT